MPTRTRRKAPAPVAEPVRLDVPLTTLQAQGFPAAVADTLAARQVVTLADLAEYTAGPDTPVAMRSYFGTLGIPAHEIDQAVWVILLYLGPDGWNQPQTTQPEPPKPRGRIARVILNDGGPATIIAHPDSPIFGRLTPQTKGTGDATGSGDTGSVSVPKVHAAKHESRSDDTGNLSIDDCPVRMDTGGSNGGFHTDSPGVEHPESNNGVVPRGSVSDLTPWESALRRCCEGPGGGPGSWPDRVASDDEILAYLEDWWKEPPGPHGGTWLLVGMLPDGTPRTEVGRVPYCADRDPMGSCRFVYGDMPPLVGPSLVAAVRRVCGIKEREVRREQSGPSQPPGQGGRPSTSAGDSHQSRGMGGSPGTVSAIVFSEPVRGDAPDHRSSSTLR